MTEAITASLDSHRDRVFIPVRHGALALAERVELSLELGLALIPAPADDVNLITEYQLDALIQPFSFDKITPFALTLSASVGYNTYDLDSYTSVPTGATAALIRGQR